MTEHKLGLRQPALRITAKKQHPGDRRRRLLVDGQYTTMIEQKPLDAGCFVRADQPATGARLLDVALDKLEVEVVYGGAGDRLLFKLALLHPATSVYSLE